MTDFSDIKYRGEWCWANHSPETYDSLDGFFIRSYKIANPPNQGDGAKKRRGRKRKGLGKRELHRNFNNSLLHSCVTWSHCIKGAKAEYIRKAVSKTIND